MTAFRQLLAQRHLAGLICAAALLLKLAVPTGYMIATGHGHVAVTICSGMVTPPATMPMPGMDHAPAISHGTQPDDGRPMEHGRPEMPCAFAGLSAPVLGTVHLALLAIALAVVAVVAPCAASRAAPRSAPHLRPPLRGPPRPA